MNKKWEKTSWRNFNVTQQPSWNNNESISKVKEELNSLPSLVFSGETRILKEKIASVNKGYSFILQAGNCAESFSDCNGPAIHNFLRIFLQISSIIENISGKKVIKIGRIAGQYSKPRSSDYEIINGQKLPCYKGDNINDIEFNIEKRKHKPEKLLEGYYKSVATLNLIRAFTQGGYNDIKYIADWKRHFFTKQVTDSEEYQKFEATLIKSLKAQSLNEHSTNELFFISHEALILEYEESFTRLDTINGGHYNTSAHTVWLGDRTRQLDSAHVEYLRGIENPIGIKIGPDYNLSEIISIIKKINSNNESGKIMLIIRMGEKKIESLLPLVIEGLRKEELDVTWMCDPMHGNTFSHNGYKIRSFDSIYNELESFFSICKSLKIIPGGVHLELTSDSVTECVGGINGVTLDNVQENYLSKVDPRLNAAQAVELSFKLSKNI